MKDDPYLPPTNQQKTLLHDLPKEERRKLILAGDTTAGPLAIFMHEHPILFGIGAILAVSAFFFGCWTCIQM